ncbi:hypothetical protein V7O62_11820 [Methanolobus sp. ZRKC2]|uniref:hypothetical protein n=1 Tax=Methanolobus sp. ZRKC2 TaxID=3125783 RepID=UPI00324D0C9E
MIELIADILFIIFIIIFIIIAYKGYHISLLYKDNESGLVIVFIGIIYMISAALSFLAIVYASYKLGINIFFTSYPKFETGLLLMVSSLAAYIISSKIMKITIDYFKKEGIVANKK